MELDGLTSSYLARIGQLETNAKTHRIENLTKNQNLSTATDDELMDACKQFESYLLEQVMKQMEKTSSLFSEDEGETNSQLVDFFMDSTMEKVAEEISDKQGLGIAQHLYEAMKREYSIPQENAAVTEE